MDNNLLTMRGIKKSFGATHALKGVDLDIRANEIHAIVGSNGAGKSTLMKMLAGIYAPDGGSIIFQGEDITGLSPVETQRKGIQVVHQALNIVPSLSVLENILLAKPPVKKGFLFWSAGQKKVQETLDLLNFPLDLKIPAGFLSVSQQQFIIFARAMVNEAKALVLDEPTARLSLDETTKLFTVIRKMKEHGATIVYISHRMEEIYGISDRISVFRDGLCVKTEDTRSFSENDLVSAMLGKKIEVFFPKQEVAKGEELLSVKNLGFQDRLRGVDFQIKKGEIVSLVGAVGGGQTEAINCLFGVINATAGEITFNRRKLPLRRTPGASIKEGIALIPEDRALEGMISDYDIKNNITSIKMEQIAKKQILSAPLEAALAEKMTARLSIVPPDINCPLSSLSGGNQQKVVIGKWLTDSYKLYLMNEVTAGVDIGAKAEIYKIMGAIVESGASILLSTGDIEEALGISDRIIVFYSKNFRDCQVIDKMMFMILQFKYGR
ncbi:MAG: sugar ABC transporter ATP-binding protein [Spirochaetales bacterium]|jgi:ABC-type sugar transport system ATPase subunit|nr:sugar ABC transporter ATP-binding protein [Spirochaetales bacterium]